MLSQKYLYILWCVYFTNKNTSKTVHIMFNHNNKKNGNGIKYLAFLIIDKLDLTNSFKIIYNLINIINLNLYLYQKLGCTIGFDQTFLTLILWFNRYYTTFL